MTNKKRICILGAGAWGTALSIAMLKTGHHVSLLPRRAEQAEEIQRTRENAKYLKDISISPEIQVSSEFESLKNADIVLWVIPTQHSGEIAQKLKACLLSHVPIVICSKGIDAHSEIIDENSLLSAVIGKELPNPLAVLSGPNFAIEIAQGLPAAATLAASVPEFAFSLIETLRNPFYRIYASDDPIGVQVAGAIKNVIAIASGIVIGKNLGNNANAALITRGLAEMRRLGLALGGKLETFLGLAAVGDLTLTCSSPQSRNMSLGIALGTGRKLEDILKHSHTVAEGLYTAEAVHKLSTLKSISMPICEAVYKILYHNEKVDDVIRSLLARQTTWEES
ncbi:MAG: NAD(P)-dependent glycerol-3-phosphate dehydrogenase [Alphaproteobacteria bacterium]|jgi:glycerol-3-phosphate dehydrogenase (NAD(P)+)|nr:NAD(P)-dependent glycerol-3-phosphate dehydrogenase [Alphaproteobacteria bacterium]